RPASTEHEEQIEQGVEIVIRFRWLSFSRQRVDCQPEVTAHREILIGDAGPWIKDTADRRKTAGTLKHAAERRCIRRRGGDGGQREGGENGASVAQHGRLVTAAPRVYRA